MEKRTVRLMNLPWVTLFIVALSVLPLVSPPLAEGWELSREAVSRGQFYRFVTGHLAHWSFDHFFWDLATFFVFSALVEITWIRSSLRYGAFMLISFLFTGFGVYLLSPDIELYRGLSGVCFTVFAWFIFGLIGEAKRTKDSLLFYGCYVALAGMFLKFFYELSTKQTLFTDPSDFAVVPYAHLSGAFIAFCLWHSVTCVSQEA